MRIALYAYTCSARSGSEPGVGWAWMRMLARFGEVHVFTATRNHLIDDDVASLPEADRIVVHQVEGSRWLNALGRRLGRLHHLRYLLWLGAARRRALALGAPFDLAWHATFANLWLGSTAGRLGAPMVLGPVGGGAAMPWRLAGGMGVRGILFELGRNAGRTWGRWLNPRARSAWRRAAVILAVNPETRDWLPARHRAKARVLPNLTLAETRPAAPGGGSTALYAGRLRHLKGVWLAVRAVAMAPGWRLEICGEGPDEPRLRRLVERLGIGDRVRFRGWMPREELHRVMREEADVLLVPSVHDEGPAVAAEAIGEGLPVVCLDRGGPPVVTGSAGTVVRTAGGTRATARAIAEVLRSRRFASPEAVARRAEELRREHLAREVEGIVGEVLGRRRAEARR